MAQRFSGFSLLEVLISTFILTFGLLGIMGIYLNSFKRMEDSYWHTLATSQLIAAAEQQQTLDNDYFDWRKDCERLLPHGECKYENNRISVCWVNKQRNKQCLSL